MRYLRINRRYNAFHALVLLVTSGCVQHSLYMKPDVKYSTLATDVERCKGQVATLIEGPHAHAFVTPAEAIGVAIGSAIVAGMNSSAEQDLMDQCMARRGYRPLKVTSHELKTLETLPGEENKTSFLRDLAKSGGG